ncbi:MAG: bifunctional folylpolyglutamate synthase/dihydrofolate synthase [Deltaproteobacteria bacterium]|nr:bifunctional folylpolyglutamate synthase/dihydrofolate synthase [Deltaproteobacteria bacterium]MBZ0220044.1 bifunctional folylpolyglutamate synthase/dihydrofolate synthase [Deltaproteobacteria bacterium]
MQRQDPALGYLYGLEKHGIRPGLKRIREIVSLLGVPQKSFPVIHVAGTNGKGSTSAIIASILQEAGLRTGLYTSPHLEKFNERIRVSGKMIAGPEIVRAVKIVRAASKKMAGGSPLTFFEFTTAMALLHFRLKKVDIAVIETGMGGRFDATNVVTPEVSVITNIGMDHMRFLGKTLDEIAFEKAGIIKPGRPVVTGEVKRGPLSVIRKTAKKMSSPLHVIKNDFSATGEPSSFAYQGGKRRLENLKLGLLGPHQVRNAACALAAIEVLKGKGFEIPVKALREGLKNAAWPGRFEVISRKPFVVLDGAHNSAGARTLALALEGLKKKPVLVLGVMADKDIDGILKEILPSCRTVIAASPKNERSESALALSERVKRFGKEAVIRESVRDALKEALLRAGPQGAVCVTGSLFTVGEARGYLRRAQFKRSQRKSIIRKG